MLQTHRFPTYFTSSKLAEAVGTAAAKLILRQTRSWLSIIPCLIQPLNTHKWSVGCQCVCVCVCLGWEREGGGGRGGGDLYADGSAYNPPPTYTLTHPLHLPPPSPACCSESWSIKWSVLMCLHVHRLYCTCRVYVCMCVWRMCVYACVRLCAT